MNESCEHVRAQLSAYLDAELAPAEAATLDAHLAACAACREELAALRLTSEDVRSVFADVLESAPAQRREFASARRTSPRLVLLAVGAAAALALLLWAVFSTSNERAWRNVRDSASTLLAADTTRLSICGPLTCMDVAWDDATGRFAWRVSGDADGSEPRGAFDGTDVWVDVPFRGVVRESGAPGPMWLPSALESAVGAEDAPVRFGPRATRFLLDLANGRFGVESTSASSEERVAVLVVPGRGASGWSRAHFVLGDDAAFAGATLSLAPNGLWVEVAVGEWTPDDAFGFGPRAVLGAGSPELAVARRAFARWSGSESELEILESLEALGYSGE